MACFAEVPRPCLLRARPRELTAAVAAVVAAATVVSASRPLFAQARPLPTPEAIAQAIDRGTAALLPSLRQYLNSPNRDYPMGYIALPLAAVLKGGAPTDHQLVTAAFTRLSEMPLHKTYSVACYLFALDAFWQREYRDARRQRREEGRIAETVPRVPPKGPIRSEMTRCVEWLARGTGGMWGYGGPGSGDLSNSQFAVLGLEVGLQNEIPVATEVLRGVVDRLLSSLSLTGRVETVRIVYRTASWEGVTAGRLVPRRFNTVPGGWDYHATGSSLTRNMTAAGVSSLFIAGRALRERDAIDASVAAAVDGAIARGLAWMAGNVESYWGDYYGMYSVEKVGDIGGIALLGTFDWYLEGAGFLLRQQLPNGTWGVPTNTAFALLFLTRATRPAFQVLGPPVVLTESGAEAPAPEGDTDVAYIERLNGFVSVGTIVSFLDETRDPEVLEIADEALKSMPPHREEQAVRWLLLLWSEEDDAVTRFARRGLAERLGTGGAERDRCVLAAAELSWLARLSDPDAEDEERTARLVRTGSTTLVRLRALDAVDRHGLLGAFDAVIETVTDPDPVLGERASRVLVAWSGAEVDSTAERPEEQRKAWQRWWRRSGGELRTGRAVSRLIERLAGADRDERKGLLEKLVGIGTDAIPHLVARLDEDAYAIEIVLALERLSGQKLGVRPEAWRRWARRNARE